MAKPTITRERLEQLADNNTICKVSWDERIELAQIALAAMDSEPVAEVVSIYGDPEAFGEREIRPLVGIQQMPYGTKLYRYAQTTSEREQVRRQHAEWSQATFGNVGPVGPLKHLSKEALEAAAEPGDLSEWADMQFLLWDAQRRAGIIDEQITQAMIEKLAVNKQREWPEPKDGEPRLHIKAQPAPEYPETLPCPVLLEPGLRFGKGIKTSTMLAALSRRAVYESDMAALSPEERVEFQTGIEDVKALIAQSTPVVPDAYVRDERGRMMLNGICEPKIGFGAGWNACRAAMLEAAPQLPGSESATVLGKWIPVSERMPEPGILVLVYTPPQPDDYPWDVRIGFDYIDPDGDDPTYWFNHGENYEEFYCVACDGMTGPSEKAPYTHWIPLPAAPQEVK